MSKEFSLTIDGKGVMDPIFSHEAVESIDQAIEKSKPFLNTECDITVSNLETNEVVRVIQNASDFEGNKDRRGDKSIDHEDGLVYFYYALSFSYKTNSGRTGSGVQYVRLGRDNDFITKPTINHCKMLMAAEVDGAEPSDFVLIGCSRLGVMSPNTFETYNQLNDIQK